MAFEYSNKAIETEKFWEALASKERERLTSCKISLEMAVRQKFPKLADITIANLVEFAAQNPIISTYVITGDTSEIDPANRKSFYALAEEMVAGDEIATRNLTWADKALKEKLERDFLDQLPPTEKMRLGRNTKELVRLQEAYVESELDKQA
jgi:hypothetical protein